MTYTWLAHSSEIPRLYWGSMRTRFLEYGIAIAVVSFLFPGAAAQVLGSANSFAVLGGSAITNTGNTSLTGDVGTSPGTTITGLAPGSIIGVVHAGDPVAAQAMADATIAYNTIANEAFTYDLTGQDLGGLTLLPGVYRFAASAFLTGTVTLNAEGDAHARFDFEIGSTLITANNSSVRLENGGEGGNVYWQVGSSATIGSHTAFIGNVLASASITMANGATNLDGRLIAQSAAISLDSNTIRANATREPATLLVLTPMCLALLKRRKHR